MCGEYCDNTRRIKLHVIMPVVNPKHETVEEEISETIGYTLCQKCAAIVASFIDDNRPTRYLTDYPETYTRWLDKDPYNTKEEIEND